MTEKFLYKSIKNENNLIVWMGFPGKYSFSLSALGYLWLTKILEESGDFNVERICSDTKNTIYNQPDIFGFSFSFDFDFLEIFKILEKYNIQLKSKDRKDKHFIFAGGPVVTANPVPYKEIFDFFIIGDGEDINLKALRTIKDNINLSKKQILQKLSNIEGVYVPTSSQSSPCKGGGVIEDTNRKTVIKHTKRLTECIYTPILSEDSFFKNTFIIELERGCTNRCAFCLASYLNLPLRSVPDNNLFQTIELGLKHTNKIAFLGAQVSAHPKFKEICKYIYDKIKNGVNIEMHFSSLRVDSIDEQVIKTLVAAGQKNITLAIEAGSERLRKLINKNLSNDQLYRAVEICRKNGLKGIKFYGMIGIPTESNDDIEAIIELAKDLKIKSKGMDISFGFSTFVPKPHTPFQWCGREDTKSLEKKSTYIQKELHKLGIQSSISSAKWDYWQAVLSRGDDTFTEFLIDIYKNGGKIGAFKSAAKNHNINTDNYALSNYTFDKKLPWDFIKITPGKSFLVQEYKKLYNGL